MNIRTLSIIIPAYNEASTITQILNKVIEAPLPNSIKKEILVIDDCSTDDTGHKVKQIQRNTQGGEVRIVYTKLKENKGKGYAVREGIRLAAGEAIIIQDADLEYDPNDYTSLILPLLNDECRVVYGSRILKRENKYSYQTFYLGGRFISLVTSILFNQKITDEPTCYKTFDASLLKSIPLTSNRFGFCPEVTAKVLRKGIKIKEVPISYFPRSKQEGKKIKWRDGVEALYLLLKYRCGCTDAPVGKESAASVGKRLAKNLLLSIALLALTGGIFTYFPGYKWVYEGMLKKNLEFAKAYSHLNTDQRIHLKLKVDYEFLVYLRETTPKDAVILYPSAKAFRKEGSPFTHDTGNKIFATRFLYPRKLVFENELKTNRYAGNITHIAIVNREVPKGMTLPTDSIPVYTVFKVSHQ